VNLGSLTNFVVVAGAGLSNVNAPGTTVLNGNVALYPTATITGNPTINGTLYVAPSTVAKQAEADLVIAYGDAVGLPAGTNEADLSSMTLAPGVYTSASTMMIAVNGSLTLDAQGNANAFWVFQVGTALTVGTGATVVLENGAKAANVFWAVGSSTTIGAGATFVGTVMSLQANTLDTGATVVGRIFCENAAITLQDNTITLPTP
jgi:hypothetical protein